jgi:nucleotide-binding universal stress UspA family protein
MSDTAMSVFTRILVGVDGSVGSTRALEWAAAVVENMDAEVIAAHILTYDREFGRDLTLDTMRPWRRELGHDLRTKWTEPLRLANVAHQCVLFEAESCATGLAELADREGADLIVVGSNGHGRITGRVLRGVRDRLAHHARRPLVVVPSSWSPRELRCAQTVS